MAELKVRSTLDGSQFQSGIARMGGLTDGLKAKLAGAFTVGAIGAGVRKMMEYADSVEELSQRAGVLPKQFQEWLFGAKQNGADAEKLVSFIERLTDAAQDMKNAGGFAKLGIDPNGMTPGALFSAIQSRTQGKGATEIQSMLQGVGMSFKAIGPMVNMLSADLSETSAQARRLGTVIEDGTVHQLAALNDQLSIVGQVLIGNLAPALLAAGKMALQAFSGIKGASGWAGAKTSNMLPSEFIKAAILGPSGVGWFIAEMNKRNAANPGANDTAKNEWDAEMKKLAEMLARIDAYKPPAIPGIVPVPDGNEEKRPKAKMPRETGSDSLISVGNFLGAGVRNDINSIQKEANKIAANNGMKLDKIADKLAPLEIIKDKLADRPTIIVP